MAPKNETESGATGAVTAEPGQRLHLGLRMKAEGHADQPVFANFTTVQGAPGMVFVDFGFLEPSALPAIARIAQSGGKMPPSIDGRLACRVVLGLDNAAQLAQQLNQHLKRAASKPAVPAKAGTATN